MPKGDTLAAFQYVFEVQSLIGEFARNDYGSEAEGLVGIGVQEVFIKTLYEQGNDDLSTIFETRLMESVALTNIPMSVFEPILNGFANSISESQMRYRIDDLEDFIDDYVSGDS